MFSRPRLWRWQLAGILRRVVSYKLPAFRGVYCVHHLGRDEAVCIPETSVNFCVTIRRTVPAGCHLQFLCCWLFRHKFCVRVIWASRQIMTIDFKWRVLQGHETSSVHLTVWLRIYSASLPALLCCEFWVVCICKRSSNLDVAFLRREF